LPHDERDRFQYVTKEYKRPEYEMWFVQNPQNQTLDAKPPVEEPGACDQEIGAQKTK